MRNFRQFLEISDHVLDYHEINDKTSNAEKGDFSQYPFNHLFKNKLRIVLPLKKGKESSEYQLEVALEGEGFTIDLQKGIAYKTVKTQRGERQQAIKIGKVLQRLLGLSSRPGLGKTCPTQYCRF